VLVSALLGLCGGVDERDGALAESERLVPLAGSTFAARITRRRSLTISAARVSSTEGVSAESGSSLLAVCVQRIVGSRDEIRERVVWV
jgi:hypothetical protein